MRKSQSVPQALLAGSVAGFVMLCTVTLLTSGWHGSFSKFVFDVVERMSVMHLAALFLSGVAWAFLLARPYSRWAAVAQLAFWPCFAIFQMFQDPTSHNLWPFEFGIYGFLSLVALAGTRTAEFAQTRLGGGAVQE